MAFFGSLLVACALDRPRTASLEGVLGLLRLHGARILAFAATIACAGALVWILLLAKPGVSWWNVLYTERNIVRVLSEDWFTALRQIFVYSGYALGITYFGLNIPGLTSFFQFACHTLLGLPVRDAYRASANAQMKNFMPMLGIGLLFIVLPVLAVLLFPPAVPLLYCFLGALSYVSFREIFLGVPENQVLVVNSGAQVSVPALRQRATGGQVIGAARSRQSLARKSSANAMSDRIDALLELARKLTPEERAEFFDRLRDLISPPDPAWASAWVSECQDRLAAYERGEIGAENFDDAMRRLRAKYAAS